MWQSIDNTDITWNPSNIDYSENLGMSINCGVFDTEDGHRYMAGYDGVEWVPITDTVNGWFQTFVDYNAGILVGGGAFNFGDVIFPYVAYFDGETWSYPWDFNDSVRKLVWLNDTLHAVGLFTEIDGVEAYFIAKLVGDEWIGLLDSDTEFTSPLINDIEYFEGHYYVGGNFHSDSGPNDFAKLVNGELVTVGQGLTGTWTGITDLEVYNGELYLAGNISSFEGNPGNHILRWDGNDFSQVGEPLGDTLGVVTPFTGSIRQMKQHGNYIYVYGGFTTIGDELIGRLARWDGSQWCGLFAEPFQSSISTFGFFEDQVLVVNPYFFPDGTYASYWLYQGGDSTSACTSSLSVSENQSAPEVSLFPNPVLISSTTDLSITSSIHFNEIAIYDMSGRLVFQESIVPTTQYVLSLSRGDFGAGMYVVHLMGKGHLAMEKLVIIE